MFFIYLPRDVLIEKAFFVISFLYLVFLLGCDILLDLPTMQIGYAIPIVIIYWMHGPEVYEVTEFVEGSRVQLLKLISLITGNQFNWLRESFCIDINVTSLSIK